MTPKQKLLIIGFSNVATTSGFSVPTIECLQAARPEVEVFRVGLGALMPQSIPPYLRLAAKALGPLTHVLLEINASAYAMHPLSTQESGSELLADILLTVRDIGAEAAFMLHHRRWTRQVHLDFDGLIRRFCEALDVPLIDLADGWIAQHGPSQVAAWLRDEVHTTVDGGVVMAEALEPFLLEFLDRSPSLARRALPQPVWRRGVMDTAQALKDWPRAQFECQDLLLDYARLEDAEAMLDFGRSVRAQGLVHLFHCAGGRVAITPDPPGAQLQLNTIDPFSYFTRIGVLPFDFYRGAEFQRLAISPPAPAEDITLNKGARELPLRTYIGPLLTLERPTG